MRRNIRNPEHRYKIEEKIFAFAFVAVFSLLLVPSEKVSGSPVPTLVFHGRPTFFHMFVLALNFAFCGAVMTIFLRHLYPVIATYTRLLAILSMAVAIGVFSWLAIPILSRRIASLMLGNGIIA